MKKNKNALAKKILSIIMCVTIMLSIIGCAVTQDTDTDTPRQSNDRSNRPFRAASDETELLAVEFINAVRDEDYETIVSMTLLESLAPKAPWSDKIDDIADIVDNRCIVYWDNVTESIFFPDGQWVHGILGKTVLGKREVTRGQSECAGIVETKRINDSVNYVTVAMSADDSDYVDNDGFVYLSVGVNKDSQGNLYIAPIDIYNEYNPADRFKDNDFVYYTVHEDAVVSVNGNILEAAEPPDGIDLRDKKLYILNNYCTGSPIIVDIDYGYVQLQDWVTIGIIERTGSDDAIFVFTNRGPRMNDSQYEIALLAITQPEGTYDYIYDELEQKAHEITATMHEYLINGNLDGMEELIQNTRLNFNKSHLDDWDSNDSREIAVTNIMQINELTWRVDFDCFLTLASGNRYSAKSQYEFSYNCDEGNWILTGIHSTGLFGKSANYWTAMS